MLLPIAEKQKEHTCDEREGGWFAILLDWFFMVNNRLLNKEKMN